MMQPGAMPGGGMPPAGGMASPGVMTYGPPSGYDGPSSYLSYSTAPPPAVGPYAGADILFVRTHFSEALAFATATVVAPPPNTAVLLQGRELDFDYRGSFRGFLGYHMGEQTDIQFTYWRLDTNTDVNGFVGFPNQFIVDPFGAQANPGDSIFTNAEVNLNVYDLDIIRALSTDEDRFDLKYFAGIRVADIQQSYTSFVANPALVRSNGVFQADFVGIGPHFGLTGSMRARPQGAFSLMAKGGAALLVGQYDVSSSAFINGAGGFQTADRTRMVPVIEAELGAQWQPCDVINITGGWMFQSWSNIGTSGGSFGGLFVQTDDSDIMSFDGFFLRGSVSF
jgi:hypothetical protein